MHTKKTIRKKSNQTRGGCGKQDVIIILLVDKRLNELDFKKAINCKALNIAEIGHLFKMRWKVIPKESVEITKCGCSRSNSE